LSALQQPLRFQRVFLEKVWGGRALATAPGIALPPGIAVGETWEVVDREDHNSVVTGGPWQGKTLGQLLREHPRALLGRAQANSKGRFPLLVKYLDASEALSLQVHPDEACAHRLGGGSESKTEAWYFLQSAPEGAVYSGLRSRVRPEDVEAKMATRGLVDLLCRWPVRAGQCLTVPGGTLHAIGAGVTLLEVQQNSDTTYRLYDWDRPGLDGRPREMHTGPGLASIRYDRVAEPPAEPRIESEQPGVQIALAASTEYFAMRRIDFQRALRRPTEDQFRIYVALTGRCRLAASSGPAQSMGPGDVLLVPAAGGWADIEPQGGPCSLLELDANAR
jgi:mannose-6-phosphate isomerase